MPTTSVAAMTNCCSTNPVSGGVWARENLGILVRSQPHSVKLRGWMKRVVLKTEPEILLYRKTSGRERQSNFLRLCVSAGTPNAQNVDLPPVLPRKKKKPPVVPRKVAKKRRWTSVMKPLKPPTNGLLVKSLIPVANDVMKAKEITTHGVDRLMKELPVHACRFCPEIFVGFGGHNVRTCRGPGSPSRNSQHVWIKAIITDVLVPIEAYHLQDRLAPPIRHEKRFDADRISAVEELCIQAGVDIPEYPTLRRSEPFTPLTLKQMQDASWTGHEFTVYSSTGSYQFRNDSYREDDSGLDVEYKESKEDAEVDAAAGLEDKIVEDQSKAIIPLTDISSDDDLPTVAKKTYEAWERMRSGARQLMSRYRVVACGYCPEVHVGPRGHRARVCGAFKHQWRDGKHGWQDASIDELIPPAFVWHVRDRHGPPLDNLLKRFYGQAPAVVELCVQAGLPVPQKHRALMRLDIAIPTVEEYEKVV